MSTTYDIKSELYAIKEMMENDTFDVDKDTGEVIDNSELLQSLLDGIELDKADKADSIIYLIKSAKDSEGSLQIEIKRLTERKSSYKRKQEQLKELLDFLLAGKKLKTDKFTIFYRNTQSINIVDDGKISADYINVKEVFTFDTKKIKDDLQDFIEVEGAELVVNTSVQFR